jgi:hypothetical protein
MMKNPLIDATDQISAHLEDLHAGDVVSEDFISDHRALVEILRNLIDTYLIEAYHTEEGRKAQTNAYNELRTKLDTP